MIATMNPQPSPPWTPALLKDQSPPISILLPKGRVVEGRLGGQRSNGYAAIYFSLEGVDCSFQITPQALCNCLNEGRPILY